MVNPEKSEKHYEVHVMREMKGKSMYPSVSMPPNWSRVASGASVPLLFWFMHAWVLGKFAMGILTVASKESPGGIMYLHVPRWLPIFTRVFDKRKVLRGFDVWHKSGPRSCHGSTCIRDWVKLFWWWPAIIPEKIRDCWRQTPLPSWSQIHNWYPWPSFSMKNFIFPSPLANSAGLGILPCCIDPDFHLLVAFICDG